MATVGVKGLTFNVNPITVPVFTLTSITLSSERFTPDLKLICFTNPSPYSCNHSGFIWTAFMDFGLGTETDILGTGVSFFFYSIYFCFSLCVLV